MMNAKIPNNAAAKMEVAKVRMPLSGIGEKVNLAV
jgi:hypothetical protein